MTVPQTCLQLDVGNSSAKWRLCEDDAILRRGEYRPGDAASESTMLDCSSKLDAIWVASVADADAETALASLLQSRWDVVPWFARSEAQTLGLRNSYQQPERLGVDRWLAMLAARARYSERLCVVDAGSATTIDLVSADGAHEGGYIIPGARLMERSLLADTDRVRFAEEAGYELVPGVSTAGAVRHGIALAQVGAVALVLQRLQAEPPRLLFCGGAGQALMKLLDGGGHYLPDLVFEGLAAMAAAQGVADPAADSQG